MITLLHPSRNRALQARRTYQLWMDNASKEMEIQHVLSIDTDDVQLQDYRMLFPKARFVIAPNKNLVEATNNGAMQTDGDIIVLLSDDFKCEKNWDKAIVESYEGQECKVLKTNDGNDAWIVTLPIMDRAYYNLHGFFYNPIYTHLFSDSEMTHVAELEGNTIYRNDLLFKHAHPMYDKSVPMDDLYKRSNAGWDMNKKVYLQRCREKFGMGDIDIMNLCPAANGHIQWLKKELGW